MCPPVCCRGFRLIDRWLFGFFPSAPSHVAGGALLRGSMHKTKDDLVGGLYPRSAVQRTVQHQNSVDTWETRPYRVDLDASLVERYAKEFAKADEHMEKRKTVQESVRLKYWYDYDHDKRYQEWDREKKAAKEALHVHYLDDWLDDFGELLRTGIKVGSSAGIFWGLYRTQAVWKTIDRSYAKLHGVTLPGLAVEHCSMGILSGSGVGMMFGLGNMIGDNAARLAHCIYHRTTIRPRREWYNIVAAFVTGGVVGGFGFCALNYKVLTWKGHAMILSLSTSLSMAVGSYLGVRVYKPHVTMFPASYDDPQFIPWNERRYIPLGMGHSAIRGRFV